MEYRCDLRRYVGTSPAWHGHISFDGVAGDTSVVSCGVDIVDTRRLAEAVRRTGPGLPERLLTPDERAISSATELPGFCSLFGVKESVVKLVGGLTPGTSFHDIRVGEERADGHAREVALSGRLRDWPDTGIRTEIIGDNLAIDGLPPICWAIALDSRGSR